MSKQNILESWEFWHHIDTKGDVIMLFCNHNTFLSILRLLLNFVEDIQSCLGAACCLTIEIYYVNVHFPFANWQEINVDRHLSADQRLRNTAQDQNFRKFWKRKWLQIRLSWRNSNKKVSLSFKLHGSCGLMVGHITTVYSWILTLPTSVLFF